MTRRRLVSVATGLALALVAGLFAQLPAAAQAAPAHQSATTGWEIPGYEAGGVKDGMGTWLYVLPQAAAGPGQVSRDGYQYQVTALFEGLRFARIGVRTGAQGPVAHLEIQDAGLGTPKFVAEVPYNWSPGRFYFVYTKVLANGDIAGWIMDWATGVWTYIGSLHPLANWGGMVSWSITSVEWAPGRTPPVECSGYPRTDAYFFPPLGYSGATFQIGTFDNHRQDGTCPAPAEILENGWVHYQLGA